MLEREYKKNPIQGYREDGTSIYKRGRPPRDPNHKPTAEEILAKASRPKSMRRTRSDKGAKRTGKVSKDSTPRESSPAKDPLDIEQDVKFWKTRYNKIEVVLRDLLQYIDYEAENINLGENYKLKVQMRSSFKDAEFNSTNNPFTRAYKLIEGLDIYEREQKFA